MKMIEKYEKCAGTDVQGDCKKKKCNKCISFKRDRLMLASFLFLTALFVLFFKHVFHLYH